MLKFLFLYFLPVLFFSRLFVLHSPKIQCETEDRKKEKKKEREKKIAREPAATRSIHKAWLCPEVPSSLVCLWPPTPPGVSRTTEFQSYLRFLNPFFYSFLFFFSTTRLFLIKEKKKYLPASLFFCHQFK